MNSVTQSTNGSPQKELFLGSDALTGKSGGPKLIVKESLSNSPQYARTDKKNYPRPPIEAQFVGELRFLSL
jgi:hypothetical protein